MKRNTQVLVIAALIILAVVLFFYRDALVGAAKRQPPAPLPDAGQPHSIDLEHDSGQYLFINDTAQSGLDLSSAFTIEAWVKLESMQSTPVQTDPVHGFVSKGADGGPKYSYFFEWMAWGDTGHVRLFLSDTGKSTRGPKEVLHDAQVGVWTHFAVTFDGANDKIFFYVNGVKQSYSGGEDDHAVIRSVFNSNAPFYIGATFSHSSLDGLMDDVRVWEVVRTPQQIADNYRRELVGDETGLVGYWKFNSELENGKMKDSSMSRNHLTLKNGPTFSTDVPF